MGHQHEGIGPVDACKNGRVLHDRQHLDGHLFYDLIGVAIGEQSGGGAAPRHAIPARIIDDDQIYPPCLLSLGGETGSGPATDNRPALGNHRVQPV